MPDKGVNIIRFSKVSSTNTSAREMLGREKPVEGTVIQADYQSAGKGHDDNTWESDAGENILMSMILYPDFLDISNQFSLSMAVALGIIDFLEGLLPDQQLYIKWPNDIYVANKKIGGILINNEIMGDHFEHVIAGIGLNVNQLEFSKGIPNPISLKSVTAETYDTDHLCDELAKHLLARYERLRDQQNKEISSDYHKYLFGLGQWREYIHKGNKIRAKITGISGFGRLLLDTDSGQIECDMKEIVFLI